MGQSKGSWLRGKFIAKTVFIKIFREITKNNNNTSQALRKTKTTPN
jgi:hypothetical protein